MRNSILVFACLAVVGFMQAQSPTTYQIDVALDPLEVRMQPLNVTPTDAQQRTLREQSGWNQWAANHPRWRSIMGSVTGLPHRAFGPAIEVPGSDLVSRAQHFVANDLVDFGIGFEGEWTVETKTGQHDWAFAQQTVNGIPVEGGRIVTKWWEGQLIMWGADWYGDVPAESESPLTELAQMEAATAGVEFDEWYEVEMGDQAWVPVLGQGDELDWHLVQKWMVSGRDGAIPRRYETAVDVSTGEIVWRQNRVVHIDGKWSVPATDGKPERAVLRMGLDRPADAMVISGVISSQVHEMYPYEGDVTLPMPSLSLPIAGGAVYTDTEGGFISDASGPQLVSVALEGRWSTVLTNGSTPSLDVQFEDGYNAMDLSELGNLKERSAYRSVSLIHDHMKSYMPDFTDLDWSIPTNIDVAGECNAFYDGQSDHNVLAINRKGCRVPPVHLDNPIY